MDNNKEKAKLLYEPNKIEAKWQERWESDRIFSPNIKDSKNPYYNLMMFPYPSAEGLHVGNMYAFTGADVYARFNRMLGKDVLEPIGLDGFGIHSENYAIKVGRHPKDQAEIAEKNFYRQLRSIGNSFDFNRTVETYDPGYYKWTQWLFIQLFKKGLAYRKKASVNWCPKDLTVLSDEQVIDGKCERCDSEVIKKELEQWFFRITNYTERLLNNIDSLKWSSKVKVAQRNWIGKSEGAEVDFEVEGSEEKLKIFTTRPDTLYGVTFMVLAPEHKLSVQISQGRYSSAKTNEVKEYLEKVEGKSEAERIRSADSGQAAEGKDPSTGSGQEKTGVDTGLYAINPVNSKKIPILVSDYVLAGYGTGAIMAVPAHDQRDFETAKRFGFEVIPVIKGKDGELVSEKSEKAYIGEGEIIGSGDWNGFHVPTDIAKVNDWLEEKGLGTRKANYHLRDWLISRQRYWGPPIPMIYCPKCAKVGKSWFTSSESKELKIHNSEFIIQNSMSGWYPVPEAQLPVELPNVEDFKPLGSDKAPLANHPEFFNVTCPECGAAARRETDVSDTFLDSSWYFFRYPSTDVKDKAFDPVVTKKWLPVDQYIGGAEHAVLHLLYSRFITMALYDMGLLDFEEPFENFYAHGLIIKDGAKMSKSKGNVVVPDEYIKKYGADSLRTYLMFLGPYSDGGDFRDSGIEGMNRFIRRVWKLVSAAIENESLNPIEVSGKLEKIMNRTVKEVTEDVKDFKYNTAIARLMEYYNALSDFSTKEQALNIKYCKVFLLLLAPFAPHMTEELWQKIHASDTKNKLSSVHLELWPQFDESQIQSDEVIIVVQVNGKRRGELTISSSEVGNQAKIESDAKVLASKYLEGQNLKKTIYIPGKIVNFVV